MRPRLRHPPFKRLSEYTDGTLTSGDRERVARHLERCTRCRQEVVFVRGLGEELNGLPFPRPRAGLLEEVLKTRKAGMRPLLPTAEWKPTRRPRVLVRAFGLALILVLLGVAGFVFLLVGEVTADASMLSVEEVGGRTNRFHLTFRPSGQLRGSPSLRLRGAYRLPGDPRPLSNSLGRPFVLSLTQNGGEYEAELDLPPGAVYGIATIETPNGNRLDTNGGAFWEIHARGPDGAATEDALIEDLRVASSLAPELETIDGLVQRTHEINQKYPDAAEAWFTRASLELPRVAGADRDSVLWFHRRELGRLESRLSSQATLPIRDLVALINYATQVGDSAARTRLLNRLEGVAPNHPALSQARLLRATKEWRDDSERLLLAAEQEWLVSGATNPALAPFGYRLAREMREPELIRQWADRWLSMDPEALDAIAAEIARSPELREYAIGRLRARIRALEHPTDDLRPIYQTRAEHRVRTAQARARLLLMLGESLLSEGDLLSAVDTLELALADSWDPGVALLLLRALESKGASAEAAGRIEALLIADPLAEILIAPETYTPPNLPPPGAEEAWVELLRFTTRNLISGVLGEGITLKDADNSFTLPIARPAILAHWQGTPPPEDVRLLERIMDHLDRAQVPFVIGLADSHAPTAAAPARSTGAPVYVDTDGELIRAFGGWRLQQYVVLDGNRYFVHFDPVTATRHALLLSERH